MEHLQVPLSLTVAQVNLVLLALGKHPYNEVAEVIGTIKQQGDAAVNDAQQKMLAALHPPPTKED